METRFAASLDEIETRTDELGFDMNSGGHQANVESYLDDLGERDGFAFTQMDWATGVVMLVKR
ncbi:hypothetical protein [Pyruvatibacter sp.]